MKTPNIAGVLGAVAIVCVVVPGAIGQTFNLSWQTIDGGGHMVSSGGNFTLGGTIGQSDARSPAAPMSGGIFQLVGGFWPAAASNGCACLADMNGDGLRNGRDIQLFVGCIVGGGGTCVCADLNGGGLTVTDIPAFAQSLLTGTDCP